MEFHGFVFCDVGHQANPMEDCYMDIEKPLEPLRVLLSNAHDCATIFVEESYRLLPQYGDLEPRVHY